MKSDKLDADFWNRKYLNKEDKWNIDTIPPTFIKIAEKLISRSNILIPGCGTSPIVKHFVDNKHNVYPLDVSEVAINTIKSINPDIKPSNILHENFFNLNSTFNNYFDSIIEYTFYCAFDPHLRKDYAEKCFDLLKDNGKIYAIFLPLKPQDDISNPPYHVNIEYDLKEFFENFFIISKIDYKLNSIPQRKGNEVLVEMVKKEHA